MMVTPINVRQRRQVVTTTGEYVRRAGTALERHFKAVPVVFDLAGRAAGMYRVRGRVSEIRYNPYLFAKYFDDNLAATVPHEVAHYIADRVYGLKRIRPHGAEWRAVMDLFGADPSRTCSYDLAGVPVRRQRRHTYYCGCTSHQLTSYRHNRLQRDEARYLCRCCGAPLVLGVGTDG